MYYKVLVGGASCHGGLYMWSLPTVTEHLLGEQGLTPIWKAGEWATFDGKTSLCSSGFHVTTNPSLWWKDGCIVYAAEVDGIGGKDEEKSKIVVARVRLLHAVPMIKIDKGWQIKQDETKSSGWSDPEKVNPAQPIVKKLTEEAEVEKCWACHQEEHLKQVPATRGEQFDIEHTCGK